MSDRFTRTRRILSMLTMRNTHHVDNHRICSQVTLQFRLDLYNGFIALFQLKQTMVLATLQRLVQWSFFGLLFAALQTATMVAEAVQTTSAGIYACMGCSVVFLIAYIWYRRQLVMKGSTPDALRFDKHFLIAHLMISTWYFFMATTTYALHRLVICGDGCEFCNRIGRRAVRALLSLRSCLMTTQPMI
jgi:hypothetical protein